MGTVRFHKQEIPFGAIKQARLIRRSSGWYLALQIEANPLSIPMVALGEMIVKQAGGPGDKNLSCLMAPVPESEQLWVQLGGFARDD